jgi:hypothetical protein
MFAFQPTARIFSHRLEIVPLTTWSGFASLQARIHERWARTFSSTLEDRLNYSASDCFENFPFPTPDPRAEVPALERVGEALYEARARYMVSTQRGLTETYNLLKDPGCRDAEVERLRALHVELDRAVLAAYGWSDLAVPPYTTPETDAERAALEAFDDEVLDRLFALNQQRAALEAVSGPPAPPPDSPALRKPRTPSARASKKHQSKLDLDS